MEGIGRDSVLLYEAESEEVLIARDTFASLRQYLVTLQEEVRRGTGVLILLPIITSRTSAEHCSVTCYNVIKHCSCPEPLTGVTSSQ